MASVGFGTTTPVAANIKYNSKRTLAAARSQLFESTLIPSAANASECAAQQIWHYDTYEAVEATSACQQVPASGYCTASLGVGTTTPVRQGVIAVEAVEVSSSFKCLQQ
jgi:hypothetical protein